MHISVFRKDKKNVGDWHSVPANYLPLRGTETFDIADPDSIPNEPGTIVLGGGGLGRPAFSPFLKKLMRSDRKYSVIAWGVGSDSVTRKREILSGPEDMQTLLSYFEGMDEIGSRIDLGANLARPENYRWVPCASCLSKYFDTLREIPIKRQIGVYEHLRENVSQHLNRKSKILSRFIDGYQFGSNRGTDLHSKLRFLAESEFVFTNSYHGVYWAILLGRKVVCFPFKNGLFSFRHPPAYYSPANGIEAAMEQARIYTDALSESRMANTGFHDDMISKYGAF